MTSFRGAYGAHTTLHKGPKHIYLHKSAFPVAPKTAPEWFYSADDPKPSRELSVSVLIGKALDSLWAVARHRYTGASGTIIYVTKTSVAMAVYATAMVATNRLARMTSELIKRTPDGTVDATNHQPRFDEIPRDWSLEAAANEAQPRQVPLPARHDRQRQRSPVRYPLCPRRRRYRRSYLR